jgi:putative hydrolase of the HAD superfamily
MPFDAILFDAGGVLVVPDPAVLGPVVARFGGDPDPARLTRAHFAGSYALDHADDDREDWLAYHRGFAAEAGVSDEHIDEAAEALLPTLEHHHWREPFPGAIDVLRALGDREVPIGVVSNAAGQIEGTLVDEGICQVGTGRSAAVRCVVDSHVVGVAKPDPAIFTHALPLLGLDPSEDIAYVGDTIFNDVRAAAAAGLTPLLHDPYRFHAGGPHRTIGDLRELLDLV